MSLAKTLLAGALAMLVGCVGSSKPQTDYDPQAIASAIMKSFDTDNDGKLNEEELAGCLPLDAARVRIDLNQDGVIDASEIAKRIGEYAIMSEYIVAEVFVKRGRKPVADAKVKLSLSEFMHGIQTRFIATTNTSGLGMPQSSPENLLGFPPGFYDVEVTHGDEIRNFGVEIADDNSMVSRLVFDLNAK